MRSGIGNDPRDPVFTVNVTGTRNADGTFTPANAGGGGGVYQLATNAGIAANSGTSPTTGVQGGSYIWDVQFTGTSTQLQALGSDGVTWRIVATLNASGSIGVVLGQNSTVRLYNPNAGALTGVYSSLS